jgi:hypothetical protein
MFWDPPSAAAGTDQINLGTNLSAGHISKGFSSSGDSMIVLRSQRLENLNATALPLITPYDWQNRIQA